MKKLQEAIPYEDEVCSPPEWYGQTFVQDWEMDAITVHLGTNEGNTPLCITARDENPHWLGSDLRRELLEIPNPQSSRCMRYGEEQPAGTVMCLWCKKVRDHAT